MKRKLLFHMVFFAALITLISCSQNSPTLFDSSVQIVVDAGPFSSPAEAAVGEHSIDWSGDDFTAMNACTESFAARELKSFLSQLAPETGAKKDRFETVSLSANLPDKAIILADLSQPNKEIATLITKKKLKQKLQNAGSFAIVPQKQQLFIIGHDRVGTLYGVYHFLESLGVRWYDPEVKGTIIPQNAVLQFPAKTIIEQPGYYTRGFWAWEDRGNKDFYLWMARNRMNFWTIAEPDRAFLKKLGIQLTVGGHLHFDRFLNPDSTFPFNDPRFKGDENFPDDPYASDSKEYRGDTNHDGRLTYFEAHPEWYGLVKGKRRRTFKGDFSTNICTSNHDVVAELCRKLVDELATGEWRDANTLNFWPIDGGDWCECENCQKLGTPTDRLLLLVHQVRTAIAEAMKTGKLNRNVQVIFPIYNETLVPPTHPLPENFDYSNCIGTIFPIRRCYVHFLDDSTCTEFNTGIWKDFLAWVKTEPQYYKGEFFMGEYYNVSRIKSLPVLYMKIMSHDIPLYYDYGVRHCHYMHVYTRLWGMKRINNYLFAKLLWKPHADTKQILAEYFNLFYGSAAQQMAHLYERQEYAMSSVKQWKHTKPLTDRINNDLTPLFNLQHLRLKEYHPPENDGVDLEESVIALQECRQIMDKLLAKDWPETMRARLAIDDENLRYGENTVNFYYFVAQAIMAKRSGNLQQARKFYKKSIPYARGLKEETKIVQTASSHANAKDGLEASRIEPTYRKLGRKLGIQLNF
ncbi:MAG: DUF4838 domain-containing protein [Actinobacteria bacterium]|nr:DUF4838 domain-containing protein [Actinomycetota bacterium]